MLTHQRLRREVAVTRGRVLELSQRPQVDLEELTGIVEFVLSSEGRIDEYVGVLDEGLKILQSSDRPNEHGAVVFEKGEDSYETEKICIHLWQIINFINIHSPQLEPRLLPILTKLLTATIQFEPCHSPLTIKNALITIHNVIAKALKGESHIGPSLQEWMQAIIVYHFERKDNKHLQTSPCFKFTKTEAILIQQTEWIAYLFNQIFSSSKYSDHHHSVIELLQKKSKNTNIGYYTLHMIGNFFQDMIDKRVTTELVSGFECAIKDVKQMYESKGKCIIELKISKYDLKWICKKFNTTIHAYLLLAKQYIRSQCEGSQEQAHDLLDQWKTITDYLNEFSHVLNCILFIGGYNSHLQDFIIQLLLQESKQLLEYFEVSYLLYRNIQSTKYQTKVTLMVEMEKEAKRKLLMLANISQQDIDKAEVKALKLERVLADGQLVSLLRLLTNLVHINHRAQVPFETDPKYLHMVLSLTHDSVSQVTMKQWAIMFIRNVSEWSQKLREEIRAVKVEMKVE